MFEKLKKMFKSEVAPKYETPDVDEEPDNLESLMGQLDLDDDESVFNQSKQLKSTQQPTNSYQTPSTQALTGSGYTTSANFPAYLPGYGGANSINNMSITMAQPNENWEKAGCIKLSEDLLGALIRTGQYGTTNPALQCKCGEKFTYYPPAIFNVKIGQFYSNGMDVPPENLLCPDCLKREIASNDDINDLRKEINEQINSVKNKKTK